MKNSILLIIILCTSFSSSAQDITGDWYGLLDAGMAQLRLVIHIKKNGSDYSATLDSPDQHATGIPVSGITFHQDSLYIDLSTMEAVYAGRYDSENESFTGTFTQRGQHLPLRFSREKLEGTKHPQEPQKPYPYDTEDLTFPNKKQGVTLAGTLTYPKKGNNFPAVILITGSGPQNRNEEILGHKPFLVLADYLTRHGIAVLRYDDRGVGESTGNFSAATTADFATDAAAAFRYLKTRPEINPQNIGLMGHSEGGMIAPKVAAEDKDVAFIVLLAGPGVSLGEVLLKQQTLIGEASDISEDRLKTNKSVVQKAYQIITQVKDSTHLHKKLKAYFEKSLKKYPDWNLQKNSGISDEQYVQKLLSVYMTPWMRYGIAYDPAPILEKVKCPVLALDGSHDLQVDADQNLPAIKKALIKGGNTDVTIKKLKGLNHLFQESETGSPMDYEKIEQTFSPKALTIIKDWILKRVQQ